MAKSNVGIEGSAERARDRGEDVLFSANFGGQGDKDFLTDPDVVSGVVSQFFTELLEIDTKWNLDSLTSAEATDAVVGLADRYAAIFMGEGDYASTP
ncbi:MAG: hypothetical protein RQ833_06485 [Sphingomonadaceae bacterium]|nr:hypothetical protein [Sphingomonadaceae bacterium]